MWNASRFCVSSLRRGHANLLCIVPILVYAHPKVDKICSVSLLYMLNINLSFKNCNQDSYSRRKITYYYLYTWIVYLEILWMTLLNMLYAIYIVWYKLNVRYQTNSTFTRFKYQETKFHACIISSKQYSMLFEFRICETMIFLNVIRNFCIKLLLHIRPAS